MTNNNQDLDDDDSMDAFDNIDSPPSARRISSTKTKDDVSLLNSSFHSAYSNDSFTSTTNRSYHRRYAFVHDPQQSIQKQQEYGYDQYIEALNVSQQPQDVSTNDNHELHSINSNIEGDLDRKPKSSNTSLRIDLDQVGLSASNSDRLSALQTVTPSPCLIIAEKMIDTESSSSLSNNINHATILTSKPSVSLKEHKQFQQVQQRFRRSDSQDSTSLLQMSTPSISDNNSEAVGQTHDRSVIPPRKSSSLLDRFGYKKKATDTSIEESTAVAQTSNVIDRSLSNELIVQLELKRPRTTVVEEHQHSVAKNPNSRLGNHPIAEKQQVVNNKSEVPATEAVLWPGMTSEDVVMASMRDRIATIQRKRQRNDLGTISKRDFAAINDDDPVGDPATAATSPQSQNDDGMNHDSSHSLTKDDLKNMKVIGQFNLGFIVVMSPDNSLWILDQHACDERYQFETLQKQTTKFFEQPLIAPLPLELSYLEEACIVDNTKIFEQNGFRLQYDETKPSRHRFSLLAVPHSGAPDGRNAVQYGKQDVQDICAILLGRNHNNYMDGEDDAEDMYSYNVHGGTGTDGTGLYGNNAVRRYAGIGGMSLTQQSTRDDNTAADATTGEWTEQSSAEQIIARLPKTIAMFASRACRNSIMIGKALSTKEMEKIIQHLSVVDTPWMCAHGRPTICHVQQPHWNVSNMVQMDDRYASEHIAGPTITCLSQTEDHEQE
jgi:DNA mismatch repair ATPase MutL